MSSISVLTEDGSASIVVGVPVPRGLGEANTLIDVGQNAHESVPATPAKVNEALQVKGLRAGLGIAINDIVADKVLEIENTAPGLVTQATATGDTTTMSMTDVALAGMLITPGAGNYKVIFTSSAMISGNNEVIFSVYANGIQVPNSEIHLERMSNVAPVAAHILVSGLADAQDIEIRWRVSGGTGTASTRVLTVQRAN